MRRQGPLLVKEIEETKLAIIHSIQKLNFNEEYKALKKAKLKQEIPDISKKSPIIDVHPFIDDKKIIRVGGRLKESNLHYSRKHPILLPGKHPFTKLIIQYEHERHLHAGTESTLIAVQQVYWLCPVNMLKGLMTREDNKSSRELGIKNNQENICKYYLQVTVDGNFDIIRVCKPMFLKTFGIGNGFTSSSTKSLKNGLDVVKDGRGRHTR